MKSQCANSVLECYINSTLIFVVGSEFCFYRELLDIHVLLLCNWNEATAICSLLQKVVF